MEDSQDSGQKSSSADNEDRLIFSRMVRDGKKYAAAGELTKALSCLRVANTIHESDRVRKHIAKIEAAMAEYDSGDDEVEDQEEEIGDQGMAISNGRSGFAQGKEAEQQDETDVSSPIHGRNSTTASNRHYRDSGGVTIDHSSGQRHSVCVDREPLAAIPKRKLLQRNQYVPQPPEFVRAGKKTTKGAGGGRERNDRRHGVADNDSHSSPAARGAGDGAYSAPPSEGGIVLSSIWDKLYAHQHYGVRWLLDLHQRGCGGILADDMGLGKTVQITVFLASLIASGKIHAALVLAPVSVLTAWQKEIKKWYPSLRLGCFHGTSKKQREMDLERVQRRGGVCLSTYGMALSGFEALNCRGSFTWDYIVLDEGHMIRNNNKTTKSIYALDANFRLILTGTPIMNRLEELWRLFDFVTKGNLLGPLKDFKEKYDNPIVQSHSKGATEEQKENGKEVSESLHERIAPFMLRRTKAEVMVQDDEKENETATTAVTSSHNGSDGRCQGNTENTADNSSYPADELPPATPSRQGGGARMAKLGEKMDLIVWVHLSQAQLRLYLNFVTGEKVQEALMAERTALPKLMLLKKITDHPALLSKREREDLTADDICDSTPGYQGDYLESESEEEDEDVVMSSQTYGAARTPHRPWLSGSKESLVATSGKMGMLLPLVEVLKSAGHRILIFSQMTKMLDIVEAVLEWKHVKCLRLDGRIRKVTDRQRIIDKFSSESQYTCFLLTTQVGGVGLTLTAADRVIILDPSWNPAVDAQAVDRAYRIGQRRSVIVYRLITCGTIEEKIYRKQVFKDSINQQVTGDSSQPLRYFTTHELRNLFTLDNPWHSTTQERLCQVEDTTTERHTWLQGHREYFSSLGVVQGLSKHHLQLDVPTDEEFWDENKLIGDNHSDVELKKHKLIMRAKRNESHGQAERSLLFYLQAVKLDPSDLKLQFRCVQLCAQLGMWS